MVKLDPDGSHLWSRGALVSEFTELRRQSAEKIAVDALGYAYVTLHSAGDTEGVVSVARLDAEGDLVWTREIPTAGNLNRHGDLALDSAGNVLAVSESKYSPTGYCPCVLQFAVTKFAPTGDVIWSWLIGRGGRLRIRRDPRRASFGSLRRGFHPLAPSAAPRTPSS
ncbi:hypothetical protein [Sorangium sp. So ce394]|uniref:hypothetical protein n=1 Tax=Sorangium sp. So ce394 TaxID=3133310 RepID=UPI003F5C247A